jgi:hypothetical protein
LVVFATEGFTFDQYKSGELHEKHTVRNLEHGDHVRICLKKKKKKKKKKKQLVRETAFEWSTKIVLPWR